MTACKLLFSSGFALLFAGSPALAAQVTGTVEASSPPTCEVHVWQSKLFESDNNNALLGVVGAVVQSIVDASAPPKLVTEQMSQNLADQKLATVVSSLDWSRYVGPRKIAVSIESGVVEEKAVRALERSQNRNSSSASNCDIELYVGKQAFQGGMKTWLFSSFSVRVFDAGKYQGGHGLEYTHVKDFPAKSAEAYPAAIEEIRSGFARNLTKFLDKRFGVTA